MINKKEINGNNKIPLDSRTVLLGSSIQDILKKTEKKERV